MVKKKRDRIIERNGDRKTRKGKKTGKAKTA